MRKTQSCIRMLCKSGGGKVDAYVMKICSPAMDATPFLKQLFPNSYHLYLYREPVKVCQSIYRMSLCLYSINLVFKFCKNSAFRFSKLMAGVGFPAHKYRFFCVEIQNIETIIKKIGIFSKLFFKLHFLNDILLLIK